MRNNKSDINQAFVQLSKYVFVFTIILAIVAIILDLVLINQHDIIRFTNIITIFILGICLFSYTYFQTKLKVFFATVVYSLIVNIIVTNITIQMERAEDIQIMRDTISILIILSLSGIFVNRFNILIIGLIYIIFYSYIVILNHSEFLTNSLLAIYTIFGGYSISMFFIIGIFEKNVKKREELNDKIELRNEELSSQTTYLNEINQSLNKQTIEFKKQQNELNQLNSTKDKFFSLVAHDLKTPLSSINGYSRLLLKKLENYEDDKIKKYVNSIIKQSDNVFTLLNNLLEWSFTQSKKIKFNPIVIELKNIYGSVHNLLLPTANNKRIALESEIGKDVRVIADQHMLRTILRNLISNAIKYNNAGKKVIVKGKSENDHIIISIIDEGIGINKEQLNNLFKTDKTISSAGTEGEKGTGLGLIICNEFVKYHDSEFEVQSKEQEGTTISFKLKAAPPEK